MKSIKLKLGLMSLCLVTFLGACSGEEKDGETVVVSGEGQSAENHAYSKEGYYNNFAYFKENTEYEILSDTNENGIREMVISTDIVLDNQEYFILDEIKKDSKEFDGLIIKAVRPEDKKAYKNKDESVIYSETGIAFTEKGTELLGSSDYQTESLSTLRFISDATNGGMPEDLYLRISNDKFKNGELNMDIPSEQGKGELTISNKTKKTFDFRIFTENSVQHIGEIDGTAYIKDNVGYSEVEYAGNWCELIFITEKDTVDVYQYNDCEVFAGDTTFEGKYK